MRPKRLNEDTVQGRFLLSYLVDTLGIARGELDFETSFSVQLGRNKIRRARLDILVTRRASNLMLVETKAEASALTDDDRDQACSYACLINQIPPLTLLTNCSDWRLFETITKQELRTGDIVPGGEFVLALPPDLLALREEALSLFLSASPENVLLLSRAQVTAGLEQLRGSATNRSKKYIPELFVSRAGLSSDVQHFLSSPATLFALLGDPGLGKTCSLCALTEALIAEGVPVLFYRGVTLPSIHLLQMVAEDFAWAFSEDEAARNLIRRLGPILRGRPFVLVIDAIDEWAFPDRMQDLLLTLKRLHGTNVKLLVSCKTRVWPEFASTRGTETGVETFLDAGRPWVLPRMTSDEFRSCIDRYSAFFHVRSVFEDTALEAAKANPFFLRILFEVAEGRGDEYLTLSSLRYFEVYYEKLLGRLDNPSHVDIIIRRVAQSFFRQNRERIRVFDLAHALGTAGLDAVLTELVHFRILELSRGDDGDDYVSFYFSLLRDFLIVARVYHWSGLSEPELRDVLAGLSTSSIHLEALSFFYRYAEPAQQRLVDGSLFERALGFTELYDAVLRTELPALRRQFPPFTDGEIGFVGEFIINGRDVGLYGFRKRSPGEPVVLLLPYARYKSRSNLPYLYGAENLHSYSGFMSSDLRAEVLEHEVGPELRRLLDHGLLDESCCPELAAEAVSVEVARDRSIFSDARVTLRGEPVFPIGVERVRHWLRYELLYRHFDQERQDARLRAEEIPVQRHENGSISYSWNPTLEDSVWIKREVECHLSDSDTDVRRLVHGHVHEDLRKTDERVSEALDTLERAGVASISSHPFEQALELWSRLWLPTRLSSEEACNFLEHLLAYMLPIVQKMVAQNFPTLSEGFETVWKPFVGVCAVNLEGDPVWQGATLYLCEPDAGQTQARFVARDRRHVQCRIVRQPSFRVDVCCDGVWRPRQFDGPLGQRTMHFSTLFRPRHGYLGMRANDRQYGRAYPVVRAIVYDWIRAESELAFARLCQKYGISEAGRDWNLFVQARN